MKYANATFGEIVTRSPFRSNKKITAEARMNQTSMHEIFKTSPHKIYKRQTINRSGTNQTQPNFIYSESHEK